MLTSSTRDATTAEQSVLRTRFVVFLEDGELDGIRGSSFPAPNGTVA
jgi:hypothetical protein